MSGLISLQELHLCEVTLGNVTGARAGWVHALDCLISLIELNIQESAAEVAPGALSRLARLERVQVSCALTSFQCSSSWQRLRHLDLSHHNLDRVPDMVSVLTSLS